MSDKVKIGEKLAALDKAWVPAIVAELNGQCVKVVRFEGEYVWHQHADEDELFWVIDGSIRILLRDREVELHAGELLVVERGVDHKPVADDPAQLVLFEPATTRNTGDVDHDYTIEPGDLPRI